MYKKIKCQIFLFIFIINNYFIQSLKIFSHFKNVKLKNKIKPNIRQLQRAKKFLHNEILDAENNKLINNYLSTKYLFWNKGFKGQKIKLGILDSGINNNIAKCKNIIKIKNFSDEEDSNDAEGHGTYLSSIICGENYGISRESDIFIYKIFTGYGNTKKEWIINALTEAIYIDKCKIINLSFGGINYNDEKIIELINLASNLNILIISSSGNEGPSYGTISFPGILPNVLTIGSLSKEIFSVYKYSSRGPAMLDKNTLITKPNTYAPGEEIIGLSFNNKIKDKKNIFATKIFKNGSSIATAIVTGFISLAISIKDNEDYIKKWNIAYLINIIQKTNIFIPELNNEYERFSGLFNPQGLLGYILNEKEIIRGYVYFYNYDYSFNPKVNQYNKNLQKEKNVKVNYPEEILYSTKQEKEISLLLLNELDNENYDDIVFPFYIKEVQILYGMKNEEQDINKDFNKKASINDNCVKFELVSPNKTEKITRVMLLKLKIIPENNNKCNYYKGDIELRFIIVDQSQKQILNFFYSYHFIPKPLKLNRILFDRGHNLIYPFDKNIMKDSLLYETFDYDWTYESISTNFKGLNDYLLKNLNSLSGLDDDYYIEETTKNLDLINLNLYSVLIIIDAEKNFTDKEIKAMQNSLENNDLGILIISEWNNQLIKNKINNFNLKKNINENIKSLNKTNISSGENVLFDGSNVSNLNKFLLKYNIALSQNTISGNVYLMNNLIEINSGTSISLFPKGGLIFGGYFDNDEIFLLDSEDISMNQNKNQSNNTRDKNQIQNNSNKNDKLYRAVLGLLDNSYMDKENFGRLAIFTDSYCLDDYQYQKNIKSKNCFWLIKNLIQFLIHGTYIMNDLNFQSKKRLNKNYYNNEPIYYEEKNITNMIVKVFDVNIGNKDYTDKIPNLFELELRKQINFPNNKDLLGLIKGILIIFGSIFFVLLIMLYIIHIKEEENRQMKINAIKTLEEIVPLSMRINDKKYKIKFANFISSDEYFYFYDSLK